MTPSAEWAVAVFRRSVLKQAKFREITRLLGDVAGQSCLDLGGDNGTISYLLRQQGGRWASADLTAHAVASIRRVVGADVYQVDGERTPFPDAAFDLVVVADFLEHVETDEAFARELARIVKPGGRLIVNVPHLKTRSWLTWIRCRIGLTDAWHGHVRPGYTFDDLRGLLEPRFRVDTARTYSKSFSEAIDTVLNAAYLWRQRRQLSAPGEASKGAVVTEADLASHRAEFRLLALMFPLLWAVSRLDLLLVWQTGYKLVVSAVRCA